MEGLSVSAVIGACSALAGVFLSQLFSMLQSNAERKNQYKVLQREKLEELADHLQKTILWFDVWLGHGESKSVKPHASSGESPRSSDEARRVHVLSLLYFPRLKLESQRLMNALNTLYFGGVTDEEMVMKATNKFSDSKDALERLITEEAEKLG
ncbi:hypothetical protein [uncultured Gilvimarinus sp.]|uniref:hypothetical protein n=1 Tax=uncultured Gilvimarinus sp. TaxID=1689143 RepID=UPI0030D790F6